MAQSKQNIHDSELKKVRYFLKEPGFIIMILRESVTRDHGEKR